MRTILATKGSAAALLAGALPVSAGLWRLGLASSEKQIPQFVVSVVCSKNRMERMEGLGMLAKQVLSQLSCTLTVGSTLILKHFRPFQNPVLRFFGLAED
jgi:hypothetical protein